MGCAYHRLRNSRVKTPPPKLSSLRIGPRISLGGGGGGGGGAAHASISQLKLGGKSRYRQPYFQFPRGKKCLVFPLQSGTDATFLFPHFSFSVLVQELFFRSHLLLSLFPPPPSNLGQPPPKTENSIVLAMLLPLQLLGE